MILSVGRADPGRTRSMDSPPPHAQEQVDQARLQAALFRISETAATADGLDELFPALYNLSGHVTATRAPLLARPEDFERWRQLVAPA